MGDRKSFLAGLGIVGLAFSAASSATAQDASPAPMESAPAPLESGSKAAKPASAVAAAVAATMRRFDSKLTDEEIATIARGIDDNAKAGAALNPKKHRLKNSDEPLTVFTVPS